MGQRRAALRSASRYSAGLSAVPVYGRPRSVEVYWELTFSPLGL